MRHTKFFRDDKGSYLAWEEPIKGAEYILGADVALGRDTWQQHEKKHRHDGGDTSTIVIMRREAGRLIQVFQGRGRMEAGIFGSAIAACGRHYNCALINIERNLADAPWAALQRDQYPMERLYVQPDSLNTMGSFSNRVFTQKTKMNSKRLMDTLIDYIMFVNDDGNARLVIRSQELNQELRTVTRNERGMMDSTNSKDLVVALMMAVIADDTTPQQLQELPPPQKPPRAPFNVDADAWKELKGIEEDTPVSSLDPAGFSIDRSFALPEFKDEQKPYSD